MNLDEVYNVAKVVERAIENYSGDNAKTSGEIYPADVVPVIGINKRKQVRAFLMQWGYKPFKEGGRLLINARSETASEKVTFKDSLFKHRCLVPASWYYEWEGQKGNKTKYAIRPKDGQTFFMAGIYRIEEDKELPVFTILTRDAVESINFIHDRMPVIIPQDKWKDWLNIGKNPNKVLKEALLGVEYEKNLFEVQGEEKE